MMIRRSSILFFFLLFCCLSVAAQQPGRSDEPKMDTTVEDTVVIGSQEPVFHSHVDTSFQGAPESPSGTSSDQQTPVLRHLPDTTVNRWQRDPGFAYANDPDYWKIHAEKPNTFNLWLYELFHTRGFRYTVLFLLGGLLLFAIIRISMENNMSLFYRRQKKGAGEKDAEGLPPKEDLDERINHYLGIGDKRQATRYLYLKALYLLGDRDLIRWHAETTNQQYLLQLKGTPVEPAFRWLTNAYEMVWYGDFVLGESAFTRLREHFADFFKTLQA
jgi:hypothetical protein